MLRSLVGSEMCIRDRYVSSMMTLQDEAAVKASEQQTRRTMLRRAKKLILEGQWEEVNKICSKFATKTQNRMHKSFMYTMYKQQFLELVERREVQKAFNKLTNSLKPLEGYQSEPNEFKELCYMLTCNSVQDVPSFRDWNPSSGRQSMCDQFTLMLNLEEYPDDMSLSKVPPDRLVEMMHQAVAYQIEFNRYQPSVTPRVSTLLEDYTTCVLPSTTVHTLTAHKANVKCVTWVGEDGQAVATGSSDCDVRLWETESGLCKARLSGHKGRIWSLDSTNKADMLASASGDGKVRMWNLTELDSLQREEQVSCCEVLDGKDQGHKGDIYSVRFHPRESHLVTAGYDKNVRLFDIATGTVVKTFTGHTSAVSCAVFNPHGNLVVTASKDSTIRFWDIVSGTCISSLSKQLGEVTSVMMNADGSLLLSGSKDNSNRIWDVRMLSLVRKYKGHSNTTKSFIRCVWGAQQRTIYSGSEDGRVYIWDSESGALLNSCTGHEGVVYDVAWNARQSLLASCSEDNSCRIWGIDPGKIVRDSRCTL
eukprot:TRINITY_DN14669_c0_g1_i5.p1 TRINITY_DN14669_c0_g1~~TRINITY_DN14669_c0_g1_i5.p1  ORF type:complete len:571 (+),score=161.32 TRINITY_DN14669_c0_g1_i5:109-1713(+)